MQIAFEARGGYLFVNASGEFTPADLLGMSGRILIELRRRKLTRLLFDGRGMVGTLTPALEYDVGVSAAHEARGYQVCVLARPEQLRLTLLFDVAAARWAKFYTTSDPDDALAWAES